MEKRKNQRIEVNWPIRIKVNNKIITGVAKNISVTGIAIKCKTPLNLEDNISITIMPTNGKPIDMVGQIIWCEYYALDMENKNTALCMGLSFVEISMEDRHKLKDICRYTSVNIWNEKNELPAKE